MADEYIETRGIRLAFDREGEGPVVVQGHGMSSGRRNDALLGLGMGAVARAGFQVVRYDARGHGESTGRAVPEDYLWTNLAGDLLALKRHLSPGAPIDGIGSSMGTATMLHAALTEPRAFRRLVLMLPPTAWESRKAQAENYRTAARLVQEMGLERFHAFMRASSPVPPAQQGNPDFGDRRPQVTEELLPSVYLGSALTDLPAPTDLQTIEQPTLVLACAGDPGHPETTAEALLDLLPNASLQVATTFDDVTHFGREAAKFLTS